MRTGTKGINVSGTFTFNALSYNSIYRIFDPHGARAFFSARICCHSHRIFNPFKTAFSDAL